MCVCESVCVGVCMSVCVCVCMCVCVCHTAPAFTNSHLPPGEVTDTQQRDAVRPKVLGTLLKCRHCGNAEKFHSG